MGFSNSKTKQIESSIPQTININVRIEGFPEISSSKASTKNVSEIEGSNSFSIFEGEAPPSIGNEQNQINSYNNQHSNIKEQPKKENINDSIDYSISQNIDNNKTNAYLSKKNENNTKTGNNINPNNKIDKNLYPKKETSKGSRFKEEINPNIGNKNNPENYNLFTKTGDENEDKKNNFNSPGENKNKDNNEIHDSNSHPLDNSNNGLSQSVLVASFQNLNFTDPADLLKIKEMAYQKINEGFFPLFIKMDHKYTFYYLKKENTLKRLLMVHLYQNGIPDNGKEYLFYNKGNKLNPNIPVMEIENLPIFSHIEIKIIE